MKNLNIFEKLEETLKNTIKQENKIEENEKIKEQGINEEEIELAQKLDAIEEFSIDRFEENMAILENRKNGKIINVPKDKLPKECTEGDIIKCINGKYFIDEEETLKIKEEIQNKFKDLWK